MTNLKNILTTGIAALTLVGCSAETPEVYHGSFRGGAAEVQRLEDEKNQKVAMRRVVLTDSLNHRLIGVDNGSGRFNSITLDGKEIVDFWKSGSYSSLFNYAISDSIEAAYDSVLAQNIK